MKNNKLIKQTTFNSAEKLDILFNEIYKKTYDEILQICQSKERKEGNLIIFENTNYYLIKGDTIELIFFSPRKVVMKNGYIGNVEQQIIDDNVISSVQINYIIKTFKIENLFILDEKNEWIKYEGQITLTELLPFIDDLNFKCDKHIPEFVFNNFSTLTLTTVKKELLSKYFTLYFKCEDDQEKDFEFFTSINRENLKNKILFFINSSVNFFKITGPSNNGKSISLLYYSRCIQDIVYLNLKTLLRLDDKDKMIDIFFYELQRIDLSKEEISEVSNIFLKSREFWDILSLITNKLKDKKIVFILDQFSNSTVNNDVYQNIKLLVKGKAIKFIICSSINENTIKDEVIKTLVKNKGNPRIFNNITEEYYYYFTDLINIQKIKEKYKDDKNIDKYELFNFIDKYIKLIKENSSEFKLNSINKMIYDKIDSSFKVGFIDYKYILINLRNYIGRDIKYEDAEFYLKNTPLKYFKLVLYKNYFQIDYQFPYVKTVSDDCLSENEVNKYFKNKEYLVPDKEVNKGIYIK